MRRLTILSCIALAVVVTIYAGCSDRGSNVIQTDTPEGSWLVQDHVFYDELLFQVGNRFQQLFIRMYVPRESFPPPTGSGEKVPLLVLLPPQDGDQFYFIQRGLVRLADEMIAKGEIAPMAIATINNNRTFGGYFYASDGPGAGNYDTLVGGTLIDWLYNIAPFVRQGQDNLAIGGVGMGAYGAFRAALMHRGTFSAVSGVSGPLDFDGPSGQGGFANYFADALAEQGLDQNTFKQFDSSGAWHLSRMFIGGSVAFSPRDTAIEFRLDTLGNSVSRVVEQRYQISDTTTLIRDIISEDNLNFDFMLPFDGSGQAYQPIWDLWLEQNLETILADSGAAALGGVDMFIISTPEADFGFYEQTQSWLTTLTNPPYAYNVQAKEYTGYDGYPATRDQYVHDLLRDILIFHDKSFRGEL